jgi:type IV secretion system protein VirD4
MSMAKVRRHILPNLPYAFIFWLFDKLSEAIRACPGSGYIQKAMYGISHLNEALAKPIPSLDGQDLLAGLIGSAAVFVFVYVKKKNAKKWRKDVEYGSARWGTRKDIEPYVDPLPENNIILTATESLTLGGRPRRPKYARNKNVLIVGGSGSGKTRFWLKPNLMQMHGSYVVTDPKGTILCECGKLLRRGTPKVRAVLGKDGKVLKDRRGNIMTEAVRKNGRTVYEPYEIKVLNTIDFKKSMHYNPFAYIRSEKDILKFATALIANTKGEDTKSGEDFWVKAETLLYCALIGLIHYEASEEQRNMNTLMEFVNSMEVYEENESYENGVDRIFEGLEKGRPMLDEEKRPVYDGEGNVVRTTEPQPQHFAVRQYKKYKLAAGVICSERLIYQ